MSSQLANGTVKTLRCSVYTRKSHEEGLDQDFNSLDAQTEACQAYILSQAGLGWQLREGSYSDAGISGGHMDRPRLKALIADIEAGLIDVVVVYKVDRLTRSLSDFSRLVETFDTHGVSFVSVTQAFNTTTSMGRLTLNVLLSFAQFEREVTAERIRDKIAASKAKGMWMGGLVPLGYRSEDRKLLVEEEEAEAVTQIFSLYQQLQTVRQVKQALDEQGLLTKRRVTKTGKVTGGKPFSRGHIHKILTNPIYIGKIVHKGTVHNGQHEPIISESVWNQTEAILKSHAAKRTSPINAKSSAMLTGLIYDTDGQPLVPYKTKTRGKTYLYYVSRKLKTGDQASGWRLAAPIIEPLILSIVEDHLTDPRQLAVLLKLDSMDISQMNAMIEGAKALGQKLNEGGQEQFRSIIDRIAIHTEFIEIDLSRDGLAFHLPIPCDQEKQAADPIKIRASITVRKRGQEMKLVLGARDEPASCPDETLITLVARAVLLRDQLETGAVASIGEFAQQQGLDHSNTNKLVTLGYLAPSIIEDILQGRQPEGLSSRELQRMSDLPLCWSEQREHLGFD